MSNLTSAHPEHTKREINTIRIYHSFKALDMIDQYKYPGMFKSSEVDRKDMRKNIETSTSTV